MQPKRDWLASEWIAASVTTGADVDALIAAGVPQAWLSTGCFRRFGAARISVQGNTYEPTDDGGRAFILPVSPVPEDEAIFEHWEPCDLLAFHLKRPERWATRLGSPILNPEAIERAAWFKTALSVWRSPLSWLRAQGDGI